MEVWKDIIGYDGAYQVSSLGRIKSVERMANGRLVHEKILKTRANQKGYEITSLQLGGKRKTIKVHREVAKAFLANPLNYREVNHKDENKLNNRVENLEWCTREYNANYGTSRKRAVKTREENHELRIIQFSLDGQKLREWKAPVEVEKESRGQMKATNIISCCRGKTHSSYGYIWKYEENTKCYQ